MRSLIQTDRQLNLVIAAIEIEYKIYSISIKLTAQLTKLEN